MSKWVVLSALGILALGAGAMLAIFLATRLSAPGASMENRAAGPGDVPLETGAPASIRPPPAVSAPQAVPYLAPPIQRSRANVTLSSKLPSVPDDRADALQAMRQQRFENAMEWLNRNEARKRSLANASDGGRAPEPTPAP
jgi:hypothetical protein